MKYLPLLGVLLLSVAPVFAVKPEHGYESRLKKPW